MREPGKLPLRGKGWDVGKRLKTGIMSDLHARGFFSILVGDEES